MIPDGKTYSGRTESNVVKTEILSYLVSKTIRSDKTSVKKGEFIHVTTTLTNKSSTKLFKNIFSIPITNGVEFVEGSVKINGVAQLTHNAVKGFTLPDLNSGETIVIEYQLKANTSKTFASIKHCATFNFAVNDTKRNNVTFTESTDNLLLDVISEQAVLPVFSGIGKATIEDFGSCCCCYCCCCNCGCRCCICCY